MCSNVNQTMFSIVLKATATCCRKSLNVKPKQIERFVRIECRRTFTSTKWLSVRRIHGNDETEYANFNREPKHFGKIISLDPSEVEEDCEETFFTNKKNKNKLKSAIDNSGENFNENSVLEDRISKKENKELVTTRKIQRTDKKESESSKRKYENIKKNENLLSSTMIKLKSKKFRAKENKIIIEGKRLINDALLAGCQPLMIFYSNHSDLENLDLPKNVNLYKTSYKSLQFWSDVVTTQGIIGVFQMPSFDLKSHNSSSTIPLTVICDNIREPGNLGSVLRVVAGVGCKKLILTKGCVDIWDPKVLRSGAGSHFRLSIVKDLDWNEIEKEIEETDQIILADNEVPPDESSTSDEKDDQVERSESFRNKNTIDWDLPLHVYNSFDYSDRDNVIVIGGETHGLSESAHRFAADRRGIKVCIPMCNKIESLNTAVALGIIAYEVRRQTDFLPKSHFSCSGNKSEEELTAREQQIVST